MGKVTIFTIDSEDTVTRLGIPTATYLGQTVAPLQNDIIIRWGNSSLCYDKDGTKQMEFPNVIQTSEAISNNCDKDRTLKKIGRVCHIPKMYQAGEKIPRRTLVVLRRIQHSGGNGFNVVKFPTSHIVPVGQYATQFIDTKREMRVWFCAGKTLTARRVSYNKERLAQKYPCRSLWTYKFYKHTPKKLEKQVWAAAKELGLVFGASDILIKDGKYIFLENNTAPSIDNPKIIRLFKYGLMRLVKQKFPYFNKPQPRQKKIATAQVWKDID